MWFNKTSQEILEKLAVDTSKGLSSEEVGKRKEKYGLNKLNSKKQKSLLKMFFEQLNDILIYILLAAAIISGVLGEISDALIIGIVVIINTVIGVVQESKAEKALEALKQLSTPKALVKRNGENVEIPSEDVVPGDVIVLDAGRYVPCDLRLIETANLKIEESALTGESVPVEKHAEEKLEDPKTSLGDQKNMAFMSTLATYGRGTGIAVGTGMNTEIGKIAKMLEGEDKELTPLQKKLAELGKILGFAALGICALMFVVGLLQKRDILEMFLTAISLAVAAIPEGLPAIVTIVLAMGVQRMIKENAIIRKLPAVETLGAVNIICSDKTGTLTQNKMTVIKFYTNNEIQDIDKLNIEDNIHKMLLENLVLCNDATFSKDSSTGDPTEIALLEAGAKYNIVKNNIENEHKRIDEIPFDSDRKLMTTVNDFDDKNYVMTKGAIDNLLKISTNAYINEEVVPLTDEIKQNIMNASNDMSKNALRVLGAAYKILEDTNYNKENLEMDLTFIGLVGMIDPPRESVKDSIFECKNSGIKTIMITGDHKVTAFAIAKELGIAEDESQAIFGYELDDMSDSELSSKIESLRVFARVSPEHKVKIVKALKSKGNIVSMTGDGVNDAPSLKAADIGVAMGITGTDVAKGASDMVLTDDNFSTIVSAIKEGRNIYNNIKKSIIFLLSCNLGEIIALFIGILLGWPAPLRPIHLLWVNLITDSLPALSLGIDPGDPDIMDEKPRNPKESLFAGGAGISLILNGLLIGVLTLIAFEVGRIRYSDSLMHAQTMAFVVLSVSQLFHSFNMRHPKKSIFQLGLFTNKYLFASVIFGIFLQDMVITIPFLASIFKVFDLTMQDWIFVCALSIIPLIINEIVKFFKRLKDK
ncbi:calcium-transporting P-type ATPase, PMR1-type [Clostridium sporogenes]|uniref:calcium-transporting P-type ATPase, PMR1-type n=1 Tax=Clostridium sporogenes TaxID=1509 RepID=UPI00077480A9|nr:calcium-transporting P-type ATPase, PMR1-type [Clostridium sporogenes]NFD92945.1 calcium-transporting P-type ATPase, PMR1-type [Clostridium sporogenes]NFE47385.1 calcium-transporting P-type ATPase, PMR1-type [Clostridium sporogenes]NFF17973.1 calcium-transporting P-type ATPase, PMR1-type [Clostridium sporogenes]NFF72515.1 calcium-transporting P-type ATPase, PMR1-type [Clostridium sporogenes]NFF79265.1 calcium-transporting P-type ATPase, PMR1-type [Clostridium sporogenes]